MKQNLKKNLLHRFCCSLTVNGNKSLAYKALLEAGQLLRQRCNTQDSLTIYASNSLPSLHVLRNLARFISSAPKKADCQEKQFSHDFSKSKEIFLTNQSNDVRDYLQRYNSLSRLEKNLTVQQKEGKVSSTNLTFKAKNYTELGLYPLVPRQNLLERDSIFSLSTICLDCVDAVKPILETRKVRKGRVTYKVPKVTGIFRQEGTAISMLIENAIALKKKGLKEQKEKDTIDPSSLAFLKRDRFLFDDRKKTADTKQTDRIHNTFMMGSISPLIEQERKRAVYESACVRSHPCTKDDSFSLPSVTYGVASFSVKGRSTFPNKLEKTGYENKGSSAILKNGKDSDIVAPVPLSPSKMDREDLSCFPTSRENFSENIAKINDLLLHKTLTNQRFTVRNCLQKAKHERTGLLKKAALSTLFPFQSTRKLFLSDAKNKKKPIGKRFTSYAQAFAIQNLSASKISTLELFRKKMKKETQKAKEGLFKRYSETLYAADIMALSSNHSRNVRRDKKLSKDTQNTALLKKISFPDSLFEEPTSYTKQKRQLNRKDGDGLAKGLLTTIPKDSIKVSSLNDTQMPTISYCLALCFLDCISKKGDSIEKKKQLHKLALQNRAYTHFRWW